jgi:hypothetical protein
MHHDEPNEISYVTEVAHLEECPPDTLSKDEQRRVMRRIDWRVSVATGAMFCISILDRSNLGAASIAG